jgi:hypothetical protein
MRKSSVVGLGLLMAGIACNSGTGDNIVIGGGGPIIGSSGSSGGTSLPGESGDGGFFPANPLQPTFGPAVTAAVPPPPISGGTMLVTHDGTTVVVADPDRDLVYVVDVASRTLLQTIALQSGDQPGRVAEDGAGRVHVVLRGSGALVTLDPARGNVLARRAACPAPRGVAWDATTDSVIVACATGELVTLPSAGGDATRNVTVERDLRDVMVVDGAVSVSSFRSSEVLDLTSNGAVSQRLSVQSSVQLAQAGNVTPQVAWRTFLDASGDTVILHQVHSNESVPTMVPGGYGGAGSSLGSDGCGDPKVVCLDGGFNDAGDQVSVDSAIVLADLTILGPDGSLVSDNVFPGAALAVDVAISPDGAHALVAAAGNAFSPLLTTALYYPIGAIGDPAPTTAPMASLPGPAVAVAFDGAGEALVQTLEPAALWIVVPGTTQSTSIALSAISRADSGNDIFHTQAGAMIACASCHPEGGDDGHVWTFDGELRRTPSLRGTIAGTAPYHWPGDIADFSTLVVDVYTLRMSGAQLDVQAETQLQEWVESIPPPPAPSWVDPAAAQRGHALFDSAGCTSCHSGTKLTNNATVDVGTGGAFQVPPLVGVGWRTPLLHDGCANTLTDRFTSCATPGHGLTSTLSTANVSDLVAYLETL